MQQALRGVGPSPIPHIQHPPPNTSTIHQPQPRGYIDQSAAQVYEQQQRMIAAQQQSQVQAHREQQMSVHRGLGVQQGMGHPVSIQHQQLPPRQMIVPGPQNTRQVRPMPPSQGWAHPTIPGARMSDQQMAQYQLHQQQIQQQQPQYAQTPSQHQRALEQQHHQNQQHQMQQQQLLQQQNQQMVHLQQGYRIAPGPTPPQLVHQAQPMVQQGPPPPQPQLLRQQSVTSTPTRPPMAHALSYLETNTNPLVVNAQAGPSSAGANMQPSRVPSRQAGRSPTPMPPPTIPAATPNMQASASASAIPSSSTIQPATLPPRSSTLPLAAPRAAASVQATAGPSSAPSHTPHHTSQTLPPAAVEPARVEEDVPPQRVALRETISARLKKHLERTEKQLAAAEKVERTLKKRKLAGRSSKEMGKDEKWRGKFDDLVLEYLEKGGYRSAVEGLKADREKKEPTSVEMEKNPTDESTMSGSRDDVLSGNSTLVEEVSKSGKMRMGSEESEGETSPAAGGMEVDKDAEVVVEKEADGVGPKSKEEGGNLGKLFTWYTVQRFASQITTTLQSSALREYRLATDLAESNPSNPTATEQQATTTDPPAGPSVPPTAQIPSTATATRIVVSAPHAAIRAASVVHDTASQASGPAVQNGLEAKTSPNEMVGITATLQKADSMRAAQEAQIREQQAQNKAAAEHARAILEVEAEVAAQARAVASGSSVSPSQGELMGQEPDEQRIEVQMGDQVVYMPQSEYNRLFAEEQQRMAAHQQQQQHARMVQQQHLGQQGMMVQQHHPAHQQQMQMHQHQQMMHQQAQHQQMMMEGHMPGMKRGMEGEGVEGNKRVKMGRKGPTPEEHQRAAIEMAKQARSMAPFAVPPGVPPPIGIQASQRPGLQRHPSESDHQFASRQSEWMRQMAAGPPPSQNPYQQSYTGMTPATGSAYDDHATPQTADTVTGRSGVQGGVGLVPSPTASRASHKKKPGPIGLNGMAGVEGEVTPTSGKKKGGRKTTKASAKGKKGKVGTPSSADGPVTPFAIPETPAANIAHTPSHPPGEFQPSDAGGSSSQEQEFDGQTHHLDQHQHHQQLQVQLQHHRPPSQNQHHPNHQQQQSNPYPQQQQQYQQQQQSMSNGGNGGHPFEGIGLDDDLMKALGGYPGDQSTNGGESHGQPPMSAASQGGQPQSATGFDTMGFDLDPTGGLNFDWENVDFGNGDAWGTG